MRKDAIYHFIFLANHFLQVLHTFLQHIHALFPLPTLHQQFLILFPHLFDISSHLCQSFVERTYEIDLLPGHRYFKLYLLVDFADWHYHVDENGAVLCYLNIIAGSRYKLEEISCILKEKPKYFMVKNILLRHAGLIDYQLLGGLSPNE